MAIPLRKKAEIDLLLKANQLTALTLQEVRKHIKPGITTNELDKIAQDFILSHGARPSFKGLYGFPTAICASKNEVVIHGIPDDTPLKEGDIIGIDIGVELNGWFGDAAFTSGVGKITKEDENLINCAKDVLSVAIKSIKPGMRFKELSFVLESAIKSRGYQPLKNFCGHGIGRSPHEEPQILNYVEGKPKQGPKIKNGMVFCIEPMICQKSGESEVLEDKWSVVSKDRLRTSHYEHAVAVINGKAVILSTI